MSFEFRGVSHAYGKGARVLEDVSITAPAGQITCLLGPSGCGKSTLLALAAGILQLQEGEIWLDGAPLATPRAAPPPEARPVGLVFQEGALFPHLTVSQNIGFGLRDGATRPARVAQLLAQIGLPDFAKRYPHTLSGGQAQRVALARARAPAPRVLLLDEPFANIDIQRRRTLREDTRLMLKETGAIAIIVTHDPDEALEMGDQIAVLQDGQLVQAGTPDALYRAPSALLVASLVGDAQRIKAMRDGDHLRTSFGNWPLSVLAKVPDELAPNAALDLAARADSFDVSPSDTGPRVVDCRPAGPYQRMSLRADTGEVLNVHLPNHAALPQTPRVALAPKPGSIFAFKAP